MDWRLKKQIIYGSILFFIFFTLSSLIFLKFLRSPVIATCNDGKKNQGELDVDCGGPCPPCEIKYAKPLKIYPAKYIEYQDYIDIIGVIENPNENLSLEKIKYYFEIFDFDDVLRATTSIKEINVDPDTKKYLLEINYPKPPFIIGDIKLKIIPPQKENFVKKEKEEIPISYYNQSFIFENAKWKVKLTLFNKSYEPQEVEVIIFAFNDENNLIAVGNLKSFLNIQEAKDVFIVLPDLIVKPDYLEVYLQK